MIQRNRASTKATKTFQYLLLFYSVELLEKILYWNYYIGIIRLKLLGKISIDKIRKVCLNLLELDETDYD